MEIDILNDILTKTVSNLFSNKLKHYSYLSLDDDDADISDISFTNSIPAQDREIEQPKVQIQQQHQTQSQQQPKQELLCTPELWKSTIGKKKYEEAMKRLDLDDKKIKSKAYLSQSLEFLNMEKSKIKNELKKYDNDFFEVFKQMPNRNEKEIMKPLYIYYKTLKSAITQKTMNPNEAKTATASTFTQGMNTAMDTKSGLLEGNAVGKVQTTTQQGIRGGHTATYSQNYTSMTNTINPSSTFSNTTHQAQVNPSANTISYKNINHKKANSASQAQNEGELLELTTPSSTSNKKPQEKKRALSKEEVINLEKEYYNIKKEQNDLKQKLHKYQSDFQSNNNRKVKFVKDITPVKKEYDKYKTNKNRLKDIKESLTDNDKKGH